MRSFETLSDNELIIDLRKGDSRIMDFLMEKYKPLVRKKAKEMFLLGGENDDLIQEGMIGLFKAVQGYEIEGGSSFYSFAELCVLRQMYSAIEASQRKKHLPLNSYVSISTGEDGIYEVEHLEHTKELYGNPETLLLGKEYKEVLEQALKNELSEMEYKVLELHLLGIGYKEIAVLLEKNEKNIDNALQRIRKKADKVKLRINGDANHSDKML